MAPQFAEQEPFLARPDASDDGEEHTVSMTFDNPKLGRARAYWLGTVVCIGGFLFGYDSGIVGGVLTLESFERDYRYTEADATRTSSLAVSLQQAGAFLACFFIWPITHRLGRRLPMAVCSLIFCIGAAIQTVNTHSIGAFYAARFIAGLGLGGSTVITPMYSSEMSPKELRGKIGCFFQLFFTFGIFTSYWCDYAVKKGIDSVAMQWQIPIGLQLVPGALIGLGMLTLKESVRWYTKRGRHDEAWESLKWIRASDAVHVQDEMREIRTGVELELKETAGFKFTELLEGSNFNRVFTAFWVFCAQQATGATAFAYYAPQYFKVLVGPGDKDLLITGLFGVVKIISCAVFVFLMSEKLGRRNTMIIGAALMAACHIITAIVVKLYPAPDEPGSEDGPIPASGIATVFLIFLFVAIYNMSWGAIPWPYVSEIFPTRIREAGIAVGVSTQWLFNFVFTLTTPYMIKNLGWGTFLVWGLFNVIITGLSIALIKETKGMSLEEINAQYEDQSGRLLSKLRRNESARSPARDDANKTHRS